MQLRKAFHQETEKRPHLLGPYFNYAIAVLFVGIFLWQIAYFFFFSPSGHPIIQFNVIKYNILIASLTFDIICSLLNLNWKQLMSMNNKIKTMYFFNKLWIQNYLTYVYVKANSFFFFCLSSSGDLLNDFFIFASSIPDHFIAFIYKPLSFSEILCCLFTPYSSLCLWGDDRTCCVLHLQNPLILGNSNASKINLFISFPECSWTLCSWSEET